MPNPLLVPDLFECILDHFPKGDLWVPRPESAGRSEDLRQSLRALAALARTCRALSEPSLNRLWQRLDSLEPLIRSYAQYVNVDRAKTPPTPTEWAIITRYSPRVRELSTHSLVDILILESAASPSQSPFLLPNLKELRWIVPHLRIHSDLITVMHRLLSPTITSLSVTLDQTDRGIRSFLQNHVSLCPALKSFRIEFSESLPRGVVSQLDIQQLSHAICTHKHLESLELFNPIDSVALRHVILSVQLRAVSLALDLEKSKLDSIHITPADIPFRNVEVLRLLVRDLQFVSTLLRPDNQMFHTLCIHSSASQDPDSLFSFFTVLASRQRTGVLQSFHFRFDSWYYLSGHLPEFAGILSTAGRHRLYYETLYPLTSFKNLRQLVLSPPNQIFLSDEELADLARNWPVLRVFKLGCHVGFPLSFVASTTLKGLLSVLTYCPQLRELGLPLDAREIPEVSSMNVCSRAITHFRIADCESPVDNPRQVAEFFWRHLPSVTQLDMPDYSSPVHNEWYQVNDFLSDG